MRTYLAPNESELGFAQRLALRAGRNISRNFGLDVEATWKSKDNTPLTLTDTQNNELVLKAIARHYPEDGAIGEEGDLEKKASDRKWVFDAMDGTFCFINGIPACVFSIALTVSGKVILGVIYEPFTKRMFYAEKEKGAFINGKRIHVSGKNTFENSCVGMGYSRHQMNLGTFKQALIDKSCLTIEIPSALYMGSLVACGKFLGTVFPGDLPWDGAALKVIVEEAGGRVTDIFGKDQRYDRKILGNLVSNGIMHDELVKLTKKYVVKK